MTPSSRGRFRPLAFSLVVLGVFGRLLPHPPNFTPVGAVSLFAGARLGGWIAYALPLVVMTITSPIMGALQGFRPFSRMTLMVYAALLLNVCIGRLVATSQNAMRIGAAAFTCSLSFFLVTNFGVWLAGSRFPLTFEGLMACYGFALPFFGRTLAGDLMYSALLFGAHAWLAGKVAPAERVSVSAAR